MQLTSLFSRKESWDWVLIFTYDIYPISFFETEILNNVSVNKNLTIVLDESNYHQLTNDKYFKPNYLGVYYNLESVRIRNGGRFHPKAYLFLSEDRFCFHIGSFNLTDTGFKRNLETLLSLQFQLNELKQEDINFIHQVSSFLRNAFLTPNALIENTSHSLQNLIKRMLSSPFFKSIESAKSSLPDDVMFLSSVDKSLFSEIRNIIGKKIKEIKILSPFYDDNLESFQTLMKYTKQASIYIPRNRSTFPKELFHNQNRLRKDIDFHSIDRAEKIERFLHAKYFRFIVDGKSFDFVTSANFTNAGFINDSYPRNLEIGVLFKSNKKKFLDDSGAVIEKIRDFSAITTNPPSPTIPQRETIAHPIEGAQYVRGKIVIQFSRGFLDSHNISEVKIQLILDRNISEVYEVQSDNDKLYIEPNLEIEGNRLIQIQPIIKKEADAGNIIYVNREHHDPNYLPSLGASAFNTCLQIGGVEGIEKAFEYAQNSGKKDWLIYLLSHWNLEKILRGINKENLDKGDNENVIDEDNFPSLPSGNNIHKGQIISNNIRSIMTQIDIYENLKDFINELESLSTDIDKKIDNYVNFCFPIFFELSKYFSEIIMREETKKKINPYLSYPEYTWLYNYKKYERYMFLIFDKLKNIFYSLRYQYRKDKTYFDSIFMACKWLRLHTDNVIIEYYKAHPEVKDFMSFIMSEEKRATTSL